MNRVILMGHLKTDPEQRVLPSGTKVTRLNLGVDDSYLKNGALVRRKQYCVIVVWGALGEACAKKLRAGDQVAVEGRIQNREYEKDGKTLTFVDVIADRIEFGAKKPAEERQPADDGDIPF